MLSATSESPLTIGVVTIFAQVNLSCFGASNMMMTAGEGSYGFPFAITPAVPRPLLQTSPD